MKNGIFNQLSSAGRLAILSTMAFLCLASCDKKNDEGPEDSTGQETPGKPEEDNIDYSSLLEGKWEAEGYFYVNCSRGTLEYVDANGLSHTESVNEEGETKEGAVYMNVYNNTLVTSYDNLSLERSYEIEGDLLTIETGAEPLVYKMSYADSKLKLSKVSGPEDTLPIGAVPYLWFQLKYMDETTGDSHFTGYVYSYLYDFGTFTKAS